MMRTTKDYTADQGSASQEVIRLPWLDMWERGGGIYGALAGLRIGEARTPGAGARFAATAGGTADEPTSESPLIVADELRWRLWKPQ